MIFVQRGQLIKYLIIYTMQFNLVQLQTKLIVGKGTKEPSGVPQITAGTVTQRPSSKCFPTNSHGRGRSRLRKLKPTGGRESVAVSVQAEQLRCGFLPSEYRNRLLGAAPQGHVVPRPGGHQGPRPD